MYSRQTGLTGIWLGDADFTDAPFKVSLDGLADCFALNITGGTINIGTNNDVFRFHKDYGLWLGHADLQAHHSRVDMTGAATAAEHRHNRRNYYRHRERSSRLDMGNRLSYRHSTFSSAPFRVSKDGVVTIEGALIPL